MEAAGVDGNRAKTAVFQLETNDLSTKQEQTMQTDSILKSLSPLTNSMRPFGLYFTRKPQVSFETTSEQSDQPTIRRCRDWNFAQIYASVILVVNWFNTVRYAAIFNGKETLGAALFLKLAIIPAALLNIVIQTAYYAASHAGTFRRVFRRADLSATGLSPKYGRHTKVVITVCWILVAWNFSNYGYELFTSEQKNDMTLLLASTTLSETYLGLYIVRVVFIVLHLQTIGTLLFPQAMKSTTSNVVRFYSNVVYISRSFPQGMNYMVMSFLIDQFDRLNKDFSKCIGDRGEFSGSFEQYRRRHQAITRSVQEADRFLMVSNGAYFCYNVVTIIFVLYSAIFYRDVTISVDPETAVMNVVWLSFSMLGLSLVAGQAIVLNHTASIHDY